MCTFALYLKLKLVTEPQDGLEGVTLYLFFLFPMRPHWTSPFSLLFAVIHLCNWSVESEWPSLAHGGCQDPGSDPKIFSKSHQPI